MLLEVSFILLFVFLITVQVLHWCVHLYTRYSKNMENYRNIIKWVLKTTENIKKYQAKVDEIIREDNKGYT